MNHRLVTTFAAVLSTRAEDDYPVQSRAFDLPGMAKPVDINLKNRWGLTGWGEAGLASFERNAVCGSMQHAQPAAMTPDAAPAPPPYAANPAVSIKNPVGGMLTWTSERFAHTVKGGPTWFDSGAPGFNGAFTRTFGAPGTCECGKAVVR